FHTKLEGRNGGGDRWYTDGRLPIATVKHREAGNRTEDSQDREEPESSKTE
ncbi:MAG: hypothetical protein GX621_04015, partial [Pirellulaceae bacterium]|nr:hypothetical protein [Pirellulaceae bacterium]